MKANARTIVLVEDEPMISDMYQRVLSDMKYDVITALNKEAALLLLQRYRPAALLLDLMIPFGPGEDFFAYDHPVGFDILEWLHHHSELNTMKIVVVTNLDSPQHREHAEELGVDEYLVKANFTPHDLAKKVDGIVARV